jgi:tetratricopeptide (TPR) repeat protein
LGNTYRKLGQKEKAIEHYEQAVAVAREHKYRRMEGESLASLASMFYDLGEIERARRNWEQSLPLLKETNSPVASQVSEYLNALADVPVIVVS